MLHEIIIRAAARYAPRTALRRGQEEVTYAQLDSLSSELAEKIRACGLGGAPGGIFAGNSIEYVVAYFAISKAGGLIVSTPVSLPPGRLTGEMEFCDVEYLITTPDHVGLLQGVAQDCPRVRYLIIVSACGRQVTMESSGGNGAVTVNGTPARSVDDPAILITTSGTASHPKRVMLSTRNMTSNIASFQEVARLDDDDVGAIVLPMTAVGTNTTELLAYLTLGMTVIIYPRVFVLGDFCRLLEEQRVTVVNVTPLILNLMLDRSDEVRERISTVKKIFFASAPIAPAQFRQLVDAFPSVQFYYGYGLTEASPRCSTLLPEFHRTKMGSSGTALRDVDVLIVDEDGHSVPVGQRGEVVVRGPNVMLGYYKSPDQTASVMRDGWLRTGDYGLLDEDGFLFIRGRKKNIIITRGISVSPEEVEQEILGCPDISEAYVTGVSDERLGELIVAYVVAREDAQPNQGRLKEFLRDRLDPVKIPSRIEFVSRLQRNHNQKLVRG